MILGLALTGCTPNTTVLTPDPVPVSYEVGDTMADVDAKELRKANFAEGGDSEYAYRMSDANWVMIDRDRPLPDRVMADVQQVFNAQPVVTGMTTAEQAARIDKGLAAVSGLTSSIGMQVVGVSFGTTANFGNPPELFLGWMAFGMLSRGPAPAAEDINVVVTAAEQYVAQQPDAERWLIVVQER